MEIRNSDRCTKNHNTVFFDGLEQASFGGKWDYEEYPQSSGQLSCDSDRISFTGFCSRKGRSHNRQIVIDNSGTIIIRDSVTQEQNGRVAWSMLLAPGLISNKIDEHHIRLDLDDGSPIASVEWSDNFPIRMEKAVYSPCYGQQKQTTRLQAEWEMPDTGISFMIKPFSCDK